MIGAGLCDGLDGDGCEILSDKTEYPTVSPKSIQKLPNNQSYAAILMQP